MPAAHADNKRLNRGVVINVGTMQKQAGCDTDIKVNPQLQLAAEWHTRDVLHNRNLNGDLGSDGSTPQDRANAAGYKGRAVQTVAINPALAINNMEVLRQWYHNPAIRGLIEDCSLSEIGVWSENSLDRSVVVAVYGEPAGERWPQSDQPPQADLPGQ
ncbi:CAP domain-containing protein [Mycolicibacterium thermoresistibile]